MTASVTAISPAAPTVGPGGSHHAGGVLLCRPTWRVPWLAPIRVVLLLAVAGTAKVVSEIHSVPAAAHRIAAAALWPSLVLAGYLAVHPLLLRWQFGRVRAGTPVAVAWAGRHRSGQPWLVLRSPGGRAWRVLLRPGPVEYPLPRWRGTPWLYPPAFTAGEVRGTLVKPRWSWRRALVLHRPHEGPGVAPVDARTALPFGADPAACVGVYLREVRHIRASSIDLRRAEIRPG
jgi:hypothetical protein